MALIEQIVRDYINESLDVPVYIDVPLEPPEKYISIERVGGSRNERIERASFAIQSHGASMYEAAKLNDDLKNVMYLLDESPLVGECSLDSDYNYTDTTKKGYRYQAVFDIWY